MSLTISSLSVGIVTGSSLPSIPPRNTQRVSNQSHLTENILFSLAVSFSPTARTPPRRCCPSTPPAQRPRGRWDTNGYVRNGTQKKKTSICLRPACGRLRRPLGGCRRPISQGGLRRGGGEHDPQRRHRRGCPPRATQGRESHAIMRKQPRGCIGTIAKEKAWPLSSREVCVPRPASNLGLLELEKNVREGANGAKGKRPCEGIFYFS